ncbi:MAG: HD domain-containing protein [Solirubrobacterales bacterium]|nr:HD domain-containing protein [Solirubrobacterales bacterium]MBV9806422.1 HD domain-containing protein [Solirubrobacterales bacterium]
MQVRQFSEGCEIAQALLVRGVELRDEHLELILADRTGSVPAIAGRGAGGACRAGTVVFVAATLSDGRLVVHALRAAREAEYAPEDLYDGPARELGHMESDLRKLLTTIQNPHLRRLLSAVFADTWPGYRDAPAAKRYHQAYRHGLLEHSLSVAQAVGAISATFPGIDRDVAVTGALLHDIGKLDAYEWGAGPISMSDEGRLHGEIALGYYRVRRTIERLDGFPAHLAEAVLHIILSHHGTLAHGSPVVPCTREATLVHMIDNLGGKLGSFDRLEKELPAGEQWSAYDKALGGGAYFAPRPDVEREAA